MAVLVRHRRQAIRGDRHGPVRLIVPPSFFGQLLAIIRRISWTEG